MLFKQKLFAEQYVVSGNATDAALKAGYSESYARNKAYLILQNKEVKAYIDSIMKERESKFIATADEVLRMLTDIARGTATEEVVLTVGIGDRRSEVVKHKKHVSAKERVKALELLGKRYLLFTEKLQVEDVTPIVIISGENDVRD